MIEFSRLDDLQAFIDSLPPPRPGLRRYFRGQGGHYPKMIPTGLRSSNKQPKWNIWKFYSDFAAIHSWKPQLPDGSCDDGALINAMSIWRYAIAQHYGPGSHFLDVSHSLETALYFAFRCFSEEKVEFPDMPTVTGTEWIIDNGAREEGWLYIFDLEPWKPGEALKHGQVVDLAEAPPFFHSKRMLVQRACLLHADPETDGGDLQGFYLEAASCPIRLKWPMEGASGPRRSMEEMFPGPEEDEWLARFLSIPLIPSTTPLPYFEHPMSLNLHLPSDPDLVAPIIRRISIIAPHLIYPEAFHETDLTAIRRILPDWTEERLRSTIPIMLEAPVIASSAPAEHWNPMLLHQEQAYETDAFDTDTFEPKYRLPLDNILVEFSPLEKSGWESGMPELLVRALWIIREKGRYVITSFGQKWHNDLSSTNDGYTPIIRTQPVEILFSEERRQFEYVHPDWECLSPLHQLASLDKQFYCILEMLRYLNPDLKACAISSMAMLGGSENTFFVPAARQLLRLECSSSPVLRNHFVARVAGTRERFVGGFSQYHLSYAGFDHFPVSGQTSHLFSAVDAEAVRSALKGLNTSDSFGSRPEWGPFGERGEELQRIGPSLAYHRIRGNTTAAGK